MAEPPAGILEKSWSKNRLQECALRASISLPVYKSVNEGTVNAALFRSHVWVDGMCFTSQDTFPNRKMAEQSVAKQALLVIQEKLKNEGRSRVMEEIGFCKLIVNDYAMKTCQTTPTYLTRQSNVTVPVFNSSVVLNGVTFTGDAGRNKKDAEQLAARAAILSILDSESGSTMSEIIRAKSKLFDIIGKAKETSTNQLVDAPVEGTNSFISLSDEVNDGANALLSLKGKEVEVNNCADAPLSPKGKEVEANEIPCLQLELSLGQSSIIPATRESFHEFKKPESQTSEAEIAPLITFVPPVSQECGSTSGKKRRWKNQKARKKLRTQSLLSSATIPNNQVQAC